MRRCLAFNVSEQLIHHLLTPLRRRTSWIRSRMISARQDRGAGGGWGPEIPAPQPVTGDPRNPFDEILPEQFSKIENLFLKFCPKCRVHKPASEFGRHKKTADGLRSVCRPCNNTAARAWAEANPVKAKEAGARWGRAHPERRRENAKLWYRANTERQREAAARHRAQNIDRYRQRARAVAARRRARLLKATPTWADLDRIAQIYRAADFLDTHVDHIVPLVSPVVCGLHVEQNLQLLGETANRQKGNRYWPDMP